MVELDALMTPLTVVTTMTTWTSTANFEGFKGKIKGAAITIFKNMTCYKGLGGEGNCTNFFTYIKAILILYIMTFGMMFLLGMVKISQTDLVIRVIKIAFVSGLMNDSTFEFFNTYGYKLFLKIQKTRWIKIKVGFSKEFYIKTFT